MQIRQHRSALVRRVAGLNGVTQLLLLLIASGYWSVQIAEGAYFRELADNNRLRKLTIEAPRGLILDRFDRPLVENVPSYSVLLDRSLTLDLGASLAFASEILAVPRADLEQALVEHRRTPRFKPVRIAQGLSLSQLARFQVESFEHPEFEIEAEHLRLYRHSHQTAHILGYLGEVTQADLAEPGNPYRPGDLVGKKGLEGLYEDHLRGETGERVVVVDSRGQLIEEFDRMPASSGRDLRLTLDLDLQQAAAELLEDKVGAIVALDPRQGEVLAMVSAPSFNPNRFARRLRHDEWRDVLEHPHHPLQNRAIQNTYPPGSVFKIVMALAGLDRGLIDPETTTAYCRGYSTIYNNRYRCWKASGHGRVNLRTAIRGSCNVYFHQLGQKLGIDQIAAYSRMLGLGRRTGLDLNGEKAGLVPDSEWSLEARGSLWYPGETISVATGQGPILVSPLQAAVLLATVANGGYPVRPHLVRGVEGTVGLRLPLSREHLALTREALWSVVNDPNGTGTAAAIDGLDVSGKTGTAQVIAQERRTDNEDLAQANRDHAWFASFAPRDDPRLVVVVFVEHGGAGSRTAAPLARKMYEAFLESGLGHGTASG